jgi:hypothetical protein
VAAVTSSQHVPSVVTGLAAAVAALSVALAALLQTAESNEATPPTYEMGTGFNLARHATGTVEGWSLCLQPLSLQHYAIAQLRSHLREAVATPVFGTMPFCWHHLLLQLPHFVNVMCVQLFFVQGFVWTSVYGWDIWDILRMMSVYFAASAAAAAGWTAFACWVAPARIAATSFLLYAVALPLLPYAGSSQLTAYIATILFATATASSLVVSMGVNFLEDVEIDSMMLGPLWSKTSPLFCMRLASMRMGLRDCFCSPLFVSCTVLPAGLLLWGKLAFEDSYLATSCMSAASAAVSALLVLAAAASHALAPPMYQVAALTGFRGQLAQLATRRTLWWSGLSDLCSLSWVCTALVLSVWIMQLRFEPSVVAGKALTACYVPLEYRALRTGSHR